MTDDELKRLLEAQAIETRRHFDVVIERQDSRLDAMNEAISIGFERQDRRFTAVEEAMRSVEERQDSRFAGVNQAIRSLEERKEVSLRSMSGSQLSLLRHVP